MRPPPRAFLPCVAALVLFSCASPDGLLGQRRLFAHDQASGSCGTVGPGVISLSPGALRAAPGAPAATGSAPAPRCLMGSDGRQACGYDCKLGSDGVTACANTPDGRCAMGSDGHITCSQVRTAGTSGGPAPQCHLTSFGQQRCGYNCRMGSNGDWYCASVPNGRCAMNSDGSWSCP